MHAIVLVGGYGTRLRPLTNARPKPMLPIVDRPFLEHQLAHLRRHGVTDVTFACGFLPQQIIEYFGTGDRMGMHLVYVVEPEPLGTGGAIGFAARTIDDQRLLVCNGDVLSDIDIAALVDFHQARGAVGTIALTPVADPSRYGLVRTDERGAVLAFLEKPDPRDVDTNFVNAGVYVLEPELIARIPGEGRCNVEREIFPAFVGAGLHALGSGAYWQDIGTPPSYRCANIDMLDGRVRGAGRFDRVDGLAQAIAHDNALVSPDAVVHAPSYVGAGACVGAGAVVGPATVVGDGAVMEEGSRAVRSVLLEHSRLERESQVVDGVLAEDAVVARRCSLSDGAIVGPGERVEQAVVRGAG